MSHQAAATFALSNLALLVAMAALFITTAEAASPQQDPPKPQWDRRTTAQHAVTTVRPPILRRERR